MPRGPVVIFVLIFAVAGGLYLAGPWLKQRIFGGSLTARVKILSAEDDPNTVRPLPNGETEVIPRTVLEMEIFFPMGAAPDHVEDLNVLNDNNEQVEVVWAKMEPEDLPDQAVTRWRIKEAYFPMGFRQGTLREKDRELQYFKVPQVPFNVTP